MNLKADFIQVCFQFSADFIQRSFHLFCDVVISWSVSINRALLSPFFLFTACLYDLHLWFTSMSWRLNCWNPSLSAVLFSVVANPQYRMEQWRVPVKLAKRVAELVYPLVIYRRNAHSTIPKGNMGYDQYTVRNDWSCRTYFCCFPLILANICPWPSVPFFQISLKNSALKATHNTFRDCRVHFFRQLFSK